MANKKKMNKEKDKEIEKWQKESMKNVSKTFKPSLWERFKDFLGLSFIGIFLLIILASIVLLFVTLIENPISLAILCVTILLIVWRFLEK